MNIFGRRQALQASTAAVTLPAPGLAVSGFRGLGAAAAAKPAADDDEGMTAEEKEARDKEAANKKPEATSEKPDGDDGEDDDCEGDEESDEADMRKPGTKAHAARRRERARIAAIMEHPSAAANTDFALHLALNTDLGRDSITSILAKSPGSQPGAAATLTGRMAVLAGRHAPPDGPKQSPQAKIDAGWDTIAKDVAITSKRKN